MKIINKSIKLGDIKLMAKKSFGDLVKAVVDVKRRIMVLHADEERLLLDDGSKQENLWDTYF